MTKKTLNRNESEDDFSMDLCSEPLSYSVKSQKINNFSVHITSDIRDSYYYTRIFDMCLEAGEHDTIDFFIASNGGDLDGLTSMLEGIRLTEANVRAILIGPAHSAASILALNCHDVIVTDSATMLTHNIRTGFGGKIADLEAFTNFSRKISNKLIKDTYEGFLSPTELQEVLHGKELWLDAEEIRERLEARQTHLQVKYESELASIEPEVEEPVVAPKRSRKKVQE